MVPGEGAAFFVGRGYRNVTAAGICVVSYRDWAQMISPGIDGETLGIILNNLFVAFLLWAAALGRWMSWFGKLRCVYPVLHLPLPEELELYRTEAMAVLGKAADVTGDGSILLDRIVELQKELSRKRKKLADMYAL